MKTNTFSKSYLWTVLAVGGILLGTEAPSSAANVTAGTLTGIDGDYTFGTAPITLYDASGNNIVEMVLDLGSVTNVDAILFVNRLDTAANTSPKTANIFVAPDETAGGFNPSLASSFTVPVFSGLFTPSANTAGTVQQADIVNSTKRYFLIDFTANFWPGSISTNVVGNTDRVQISDVRIAIVPEVTTFSLIGMGGLLLSMRCRRGF